MGISTKLALEFQFLLVRLKVETSKLIGWLNSISIPSGTIKRIAPFVVMRNAHISIPSGTIKREVGWCQYGFHSRISIPSGTIKRWKQNPKLNITLISIPSGTIKSNQPPIHHQINPISIPSGTIKSRTGLLACQDNNGISIPSGTIKRFRGKDYWLKMVKFQFLLVRLKVGKPVIFKGRYARFQFLLVRLKVFVF